MSKDVTMAPGPLNVPAMADEIKDRISALASSKIPELRGVRREFSRRIAKEPPEAVLQLAFRLLAGLEYVPRFIAYELVHYHRPALRSLDQQSLERLAKGMKTWEAVDTFGCYLSGPAWREGQIADAVVHAWAASDDRWWRRAALVSTVPLNNKSRGGIGDSPRTLEVCRRLARDRDDMVVKAVSWSLRELIRHDSPAVADFVDEHSEVLAARVKREVWNKLTTGLKNRRR